MTIGYRIKQRRLKLNLSVDDLAQKLGKNRATIYRYESNDIENFPTTILMPLAKALDTTPTFLMGWEDDDNKLTSIIDSKETDETAKLPDDIRAAALGMMNLSEEDKSLAINMINSLAQKGRGAQENC